MTRTLVAVTVRLSEGGDVVIDCLCDCGTPTEVTVAGAGDVARQFAYTCRCEASHWLTLEALAAEEAET